MARGPSKWVSTQAHDPSFLHLVPWHDAIVAAKRILLASIVSQSKLGRPKGLTFLSHAHLQAVV